jgi:hypothetical protein
LIFQFFETRFHAKVKFKNSSSIVLIMYPLHIKDIVLGVLVAYVVIDLLLAYAIRVRHPGVFATLTASLSDENIGVVLVLGIAAGLLVYYLARKSREQFSTRVEY